MGEGLGFFFSFIVFVFFIKILVPENKIKAYH